MALGVLERWWTKSMFRSSISIVHWFEELNRFCASGQEKVDFQWLRRVRAAPSWLESYSLIRRLGQRRRLGGECLQASR
jgi:hypothetical protein